MYVPTVTIRSCVENAVLYSFSSMSTSVLLLKYVTLGVMNVLEVNNLFKSLSVAVSILKSVAI